MSETFSNGGGAVVGTGGIDNVATTLPTLYRVGLPTTGTFRIKIESEILKVTTGGQSTASWTVVRGQEGTTAAAHAEGVAITQPLTAQALTDALAAAGSAGFTSPMTSVGDLIVGGTAGAATRLAVGTTGKVLTVTSGSPAWATAAAGNITTQGVYYAEPGTPAAGDLHFATDDTSLQRFVAGSSWKSYGPIYPLTDPPFLTETNLSSYAQLDLEGSRCHLDGVSSGAEALRIAEVTTTANVAFTVLAQFQANFAVGSGLSEGGLVLRLGSGTTCITFSVQSVSGVCKVAIHYWDDYATKNASDVNLVVPALIPNDFFLKIVDDGTTNRDYYWSPNGVYFNKVYTATRSTFLTSPTRVGFFYNTTVSTTARSGIRMLSWVKS